MSESKLPREKSQNVPSQSEPQTPGQQKAEPQASGKKKEKEKLPFPVECFGWLQSVTVALAILILAATFLGRVIIVSGSSMVPTLENGDLLLLRCAGYEPQQGDIVVLRKAFSDIDTPIVKRVIAVGGQTVEIDYNTSTLYIDGQPQEEPYLGEPMRYPGSGHMDGTYWEVPEGSIFVMGDNRNASSDSRYDELGVIDTRYVIGKALITLLPPQHIGLVT